MDDGSTDERTREEAERLAAQGIKVLRQENKGLAARNAGISAAWAENIFPLDADDRMRTEWLDRGIHMLESNPTQPAWCTEMPTAS